MATLQNIRSKGPLLVIVIGLALFAFIAGDAWKVMQPHQAHDVGEVNGDALSAQEYQNLVEEYTEVVKLMRGVNALNDEQTNQVRDEVWRSYVIYVGTPYFVAHLIGLFVVQCSHSTRELYHLGIFFYQILILLSGKSISVHLTYVMCLVRLHYLPRVTRDESKQRQTDNNHQ